MQGVPGAKNYGAQATVNEWYGPPATRLRDESNETDHDAELKRSKATVPFWFISECQNVDQPLYRNARERTGNTFIPAALRHRHRGSYQRQPWNPGVIEAWNLLLRPGRRPEKPILQTVAREWKALPADYE
jgi:hypothetical protein